MTAGSWSDLRLELVPGLADGDPGRACGRRAWYRPGLSVSGRSVWSRAAGRRELTETVAAPVEETQEATPEEVATALPFPTLALPEEPTEQPTEGVSLQLTALPFPTLGVPEQPPEQLTAVPTIVPQPVPVVASMDDGAPDWQGVSGWVLTSEAAYGGAGLG
ncbi:MAG: hypothetical protein U0703_24940 [Anaerolineae bacterium]